MSDAPSRKKSRLVIVVVVLLFIFLLISFLRVFFKDYELRKEIERLQTDVGKLEKPAIERTGVGPGRFQRAYRRRDEPVEENQSPEVGVADEIEEFCHRGIR